MIVSSALMIWKGLIVVTGSESPIVVVLRWVNGKAFCSKSRYCCAFCLLPLGYSWNLKCHLFKEGLKRSLSSSCVWALAKVTLSVAMAQFPLRFVGAVNVWDLLKSKFLHSVGKPLQIAFRDLGSVKGLSSVTEWVRLQISVKIVGLSVRIKCSLISWCFFHLCQQTLSFLLFVVAAWSQLFTGETCCS